MSKVKGMTKELSKTTKCIEEGYLDVSEGFSGSPGGGGYVSEVGGMANGFTGGVSPDWDV